MRDEVLHALRVRLPVEAADEPGALAALTALAAVFPEAVGTADAAGLVAAAFPGADVGGALNAAPRSVASPFAAASVASPSAGGAVLSVAPNPVSSSASVALTLGADAPSVTVGVYDAVGREVVRIHDGALAAGEHRLALDASALTAGMYVVRAEVRAGGSAPMVAVRRLAVVR